MPKEDVIALIAKNPLDFEPGTKYAYSNAGYFLLGAIIEKVAGSTYPELLNQKINSKIGLKDTYPGSGKIDITNNESFSYRLFRAWELQPETNMSLLFGSGFLISTTADMATFIYELFNGKLVAKESLDQMIQHNMGIDTFSYNGKRAYGHTGGIDGFGAWLAYIPDEKLAVSYGTNGKVYPVAKLIEDVFNIYYNKVFTLPSFEGISISTELLDKYVGVYSSPDVPRKFKITREANILYVQPGDESAVPLEATAEDQFRIESVGIILRFDAAKKQLFLIRRNGPERVLTKEE